MSSSAPEEADALVQQVYVITLSGCAAFILAVIVYVLS